MRTSCSASRRRRPLLLAGAGASMLIAVLVGAASGAPPAAADGAGPTNFESVIDSVQPDLDGVTVEVRGGDAFLQVTADPGTSVDIPGYNGEPYLRIEADGTVLQNDRSPSVHLNQTRMSSNGEIPSDLSSTADPEWSAIAEGGTVAWHDHRIHWMSSEEPDVSDGVVQDWVLPLEVDGTEVEVTGRLLRHDDVFPWAALVALGVGAAAVALGRNDRRRLDLLAGAAVLAEVLAVASARVDPPGAGASRLPVLLPLLAVACLVVARHAPRALPPVVRYMALPLASVALLYGWAVQTIGALWMPTLPTVLPGWVERAGTGVVIGVITGTAVAILIRPLPDESSEAPAPGPSDTSPPDPDGTAAA